MPPPASPWPLLSIDGGGMRGLLAARSLQELERRMGRPARDLFAAGVGTSTGALLLGGALGPDDPPSAEHLAESYRELGPRVFGPGLRVGLRGDAQAQGRLRTVVEGVVGNRRLSGSARRLLLTAADIGRRRPVVLDSADDPAGTGDPSLTDAVLASAALPGYFPPVRIAGAELVDGGLWAKDPTPVALARLRDQAPGLVVSLGTGSTRGAHSRAESIMDLVAATLGADAAPSTADVPGVHVLRLDPPLPPGVVRLDAAGPADIAALDAVADRYMAEAASEFDRVAAILETAGAG